MKKYFLFSLFVLVSFFSSFSFADVQSIFMKFCNEGTGDLSTTYTAMIEPGQQKELCINIDNRGSNDAIVSYDFTKAHFQGKHQLCSTSNDFSKFFLDNPNREILISGNSSLTIKETIIPPAGQIGMYYGCLVYKLSEPDVKNMGGLFNLVVRKTSFINIFVGSEDSIKNIVQFIPVTGSIYSTNKNIGASFNDDGDLILNFLMKNNGNLTQNVSLKGKFHNFLGLEKNIDIPVKKLLPGEVYQASGNVGIIPFYKGLFSVNFTLHADPVFEFDVSNIADQYKQPTIIKEKTSLFIFSWIYVVLLLVILLLLVKALVSKKRKNRNTVVETSSNSNI